MLELYTTSTCPYCAQLRADLEWRRQPFREYDIERDEAALKRMLDLCEGNASVPVLVQDGRLIQVGYEGRSCYARVNR